MHLAVLSLEGGSVELRRTRYFSSYYLALWAYGLGRAEESAEAGFNGTFGEELVLIAPPLCV